MHRRAHITQLPSKHSPPCHDIYPASRAAHSTRALPKPSASWPSSSVEHVRPVIAIPSPPERLRLSRTTTSQRRPSSDCAPFRARNPAAASSSATCPGRGPACRARAVLACRALCRACASGVGHHARRNRHPTRTVPRGGRRPRRQLPAGLPSAPPPPPPPPWRTGSGRRCRRRPTPWHAGSLSSWLMTNRARTRATWCSQRSA